jgi:hypothetical protein
MAVVAVLASLGMLAVWPAPPADAALAGCRADPLFLLSDGTILDVSVAIDTDVKNVDVIQYVVHGPRGTRLVAAISTPTIGFEGLERVRYVADQAPNRFVTDTLVQTSTDSVPVEAQTIFAGHHLGLLSLRLRAHLQVVRGFDGQHLIVSLSK